MNLGPYEQGIYTGDCLDLMTAIPDKTVDLIIADPPYGIGYASSHMTRRNGEPRINRPDFGPDVYDARWLAEAERVLKDGGALYLFTRWDILPRWRADIEAAGLKVVQRLIWDKTHWGMGDLRYYGSQTEDILFCIKGCHVMRWDKREGNVLKGNTYVLAEGQFDHPTQKPEAVIARLIVNSSSPGDIVIDPFVGSGTTPTVCKRLGRWYWACDIRAEYVEMARQRVADAPVPLFTLEPEQLGMDL